MKVVLLSDTHGRHEEIEVPPGDLLIHAGDSCSYGTVPELRSFISWFATQPHEHKVMIAGNHDWPLAKRETRYKIQLIKDLGINYLEDSPVVIDGFKIYGSPWQPEFCNWAFNLPRGGAELKEKCALIPGNTDILVTHGAPYGIGDPAGPNKHSVGCSDLLDAVKRVNPLLHVFGHLHDGNGTYYFENLRTTFVNASNLDDYYNYVHEPMVIDL